MTHDGRSFVIVGGGLAAATAAKTLREEGFDGRLTLVSAESHVPYERPPLSKDFLLDDEPGDPSVHPPSWYDDHGVELVLGSPATAVDPAHLAVTVGDRDLHYDRLLLATGSAPRRFPALEAGGGPVAYLRTLDQARLLREHLRAGSRVLVVGAGWIGMEVAAAARTHGCQVTVVEPQPMPLANALGPEVARVFAERHRARGVDLRTGHGVDRVEQQGGRTVVHLDDGSQVSADLVVVGIGAAPVTGLAVRAGLESADGVLVDDHLLTSAPHVFAAGDVANAYHPRLGHPLRVEHWDNAIGQGETAARNMLGARESYRRMPYFFTDQYDLGMEYVGYVGPAGYDEAIVRGDLSEGVFTAFWLRNRIVVAGMHVNDWDAIDHIRRMVGERVENIAALHDPSVPLEAVA